MWKKEGLYSGGYLGDEDTLIRGVEGVPSVASGSSSDADAQLLPWLLQDNDLLLATRDIITINAYQNACVREP